MKLFAKSGEVNSEETVHIALRKLWSGICRSYAQQLPGIMAFFY